MMFPGLEWETEREGERKGGWADTAPGACSRQSKHHVGAARPFVCLAKESHGALGQEGSKTSAETQLAPGLMSSLPQLSRPSRTALPTPQEKACILRAQLGKRKKPGQFNTPPPKKRKKRKEKGKTFQKFQGTFFFWLPPNNGSEECHLRLRQAGTSSSGTPAEPAAVRGGAADRPSGGCLQGEWVRGSRKQGLAGQREPGVAVLQAMAGWPGRRNRPHPNPAP